MKPNAWRWIITVGAAVFLAVVCVVAYLKRQDVRVVSPGEEAAIAEALLGERLSGPRYFNPVAGGGVETAGSWISVTDAMAQVSRIAGERKLDSEAVRKLELLIDRMAESHPYRAVGGERIDLPRLNLSLDSIGK
ncbi:potassium-transporting ATPase subunit C [Luteolibacter yonseiensis]|uniref:Potassium-transporting ATPase subunit C n=1 Tax=Luteolibacter yonseiensis TaxID=1144680 RepID=A0A934R9D6_9BACT|nr:potassium-transporting ATPase subunit C [Luteolibacter yonseiensis]MBK1818323.1 potassium-transporting ATPase subunit C [Luteolibacter yonseiensis]